MSGQAPSGAAPRAIVGMQQFHKSLADLSGALRHLSGAVAGEPIACLTIKREEFEALAAAAGVDPKRRVTGMELHGIRIEKEPR